MGRLMLSSRDSRDDTQMGISVLLQMSHSGDLQSHVSDDLHLLKHGLGRRLASL